MSNASTYQDPSVQKRKDLKDYDLDIHWIQPPVPLWRRFSWSVLFPWMLLTAVSLLWASTGHVSKATCPGDRDNILGAPITWVEKTYTSAIDGSVYDVYAQSNPDVDEAWRAVRYEGVTAITSSEVERLPGHRTSAELYGSQEGYAVLLEVFHQIHCLDSIRRAFFRGPDEPAPHGFEGSPAHGSHCFSYLLQSLMCHADVGVMTTRWVDQSQDFAAQFNVTRQCRDFTGIKEWAKGRTSKFQTPGDLAMETGVRVS